jgi:hypothetical protein
VGCHRRGSGVVAPDGEILASAGDGDPATVSAETDLERAFLCPEDTWEYVYSGLAKSRERRLKLRHPGAYGVIADPAPPALRAYSPQTLPRTADEIRAVYEKQRDEYLRTLRGEDGRYRW